MIYVSYVDYNFMANGYYVVYGDNLVMMNRLHYRLWGYLGDWAVLV